jgi:SEC-C motif
MKIGRNDLFPCGIGRKYKNCCLEDQSSGLPHEGPAGQPGLFFISLLDMLPTFFLLLGACAAIIEM